MQIKFVGWIVILVLGTVLVGTLWYFLLVPKSASPQITQQSPITLPSSGVITPVTTPVSPSMESQPSPQKISVATQNGSVVITNDFIHNNVTLPDPSNVGNYYLTGSSTNGYAIGYRTSAQFFTIALEQEPLSQTRTAAEDFLLSTLGITENQLCSLNYYIGTDANTNSFYAGKNLGFSFCPGATVLPQ
ncbi:MAG TPA: hypothetical protein VNF51_01900 [Candidatus Paceibacterota bacterium]|nr:hypothetical protein [Candidatus Paceibacterota bacterium]